MGESYLWRMANMSRRTCVVVKQMQSNPIQLVSHPTWFPQAQSQACWAQLQLGCQRSAWLQMVSCLKQILSLWLRTRMQQAQWGERILQLVPHPAWLPQAQPQVCWAQLQLQFRGAWLQMVSHLKLAKSPWLRTRDTAGLIRWKDTPADASSNMVTTGSLGIVECNFNWNLNVVRGYSWPLAWSWHCHCGWGQGCSRHDELGGYSRWHLARPGYQRHSLRFDWHSFRWNFNVVCGYRWSLAWSWHCHRRWGHGCSRPNQVGGYST